MYVTGRRRRNANPISPSRAPMPSEYRTYAVVVVEPARDDEARADRGRRDAQRDDVAALAARAGDRDDQRGEIGQRREAEHERPRDRLLGRHVPARGEEHHARNLPVRARP
jgi:hypothetical protein